MRTRSFLALAVAALCTTPLHAQSVPSHVLGKPNAMIAEPFSRVYGATEMRDGRVIVSDIRDATLTVADFRTGKSAQIGRNGEGPNEYAVPGIALRTPGDSFYLVDGRNRRFLRLDGNGALAGTVPFERALMMGGIGGGDMAADSMGRLYWATDFVDMNPTTGPKRALKSHVARWSPGNAAKEIVAEVGDHAPELHANKFFPYAERDGWVVAPDGRVGVLSAREYRLRWYENGKLMLEGPPLAYTPIMITSAERAAFRNERAAQGPAGGATITGGGANDATRQEAARRSMLDVYPDNFFPKAMPPFVDGGVRRSPGGDIWVERSRAASDKVRRFDVLTAAGALRATVQLPEDTHMVSLQPGGIYLVRTDADGLQFLGRYTWPGTLR
ncbi:MAG: hypothetical protein P3A28_04020 [Gemmatimonadota bacterium]|nr:hypothetical protein [Gemmatimonadota bacterium]